MPINNEVITNSKNNDANNSNNNSTNIVIMTINVKLINLIV